MPNDGQRALTTRRTFVSLLGLSSLSLTGLWAGYDVLMPGGHHGGGEGMSVEEFRHRTQEFVEANQLDDGSVKPGAATDGGHATEAGHQEEAGSGGDGHGEGGHEATDVYMMAYQWGYSPSTLRLETGQTYRFRMMSIDVIHGLSINVGSRSLMHRLPPGSLVEDEIVFDEPGEYLVYCSYYCGQAHDTMQGTIIVEDGHE